MKSPRANLNTKKKISAVRRGKVEARNRFLERKIWLVATTIPKNRAIVKLPREPDTRKNDWVTLGKNFLNTIATAEGKKTILNKKKHISIKEISTETPKSTLNKKGIENGISAEVRITKTVDHRTFSFKKLAMSGVAVAPEAAKSKKKAIRVSWLRPEERK